MRKIFIASDHAGFALKQYLLEQIKGGNFLIQDCGTYNEKSCDFPEFAYQIICNVKNDTTNNVGILICKTGIGMSMFANRFPWIRAALCFSVESAILTREHNNANILCLGSIYYDNFAKYQQIAESFLNTKFLDGKYQKRINLIDEYCQK